MWNVYPYSSAYSALVRPYRKEFAFVLRLYDVPCNEHSTRTNPLHFTLDMVYIIICMQCINYIDEV